MMTGDGNSAMTFGPATTLTDADRAALGTRAGTTIPPEVTTRGQAAQWLDTQGII
jgi:hypothetical protein